MSYQNPYILQQLPFGQFPQTVLPFAAPQVPEFQIILLAWLLRGLRPGKVLKASEDLPSVVGAPVAATPGAIVVDFPPITGSAVVLVLGWALPAGAPDVALLPPVHPFWQPFATRQCSGVEPQYLLTSKLAYLNQKTFYSLQNISKAFLPRHEPTHTESNIRHKDHSDHKSSH